MSVHLAYPWALALLVLVPIVTWRRYARNRSPALAFPGLAAAPALPAGWRARAVAALPALRAVALAALVMALARPQHGIGRVIADTEAVAIQLAVDRSGSMAEPMQFEGRPAAKIDVVKRVLADFVLGDGRDLKGRPYDLIGLTAFAGIAETMCPLVRDGRMVVESARTIRLAMQGPDAGTAIGDGLALAVARLCPEEAGGAGGASEEGGAGTRIRSRVVVLLTDGRNNRGDRDPLEAAALAAQKGIRVHTIGIGGGAAPAGRGGVFGDLLRMDDLDEPTLERIAQTTGGIYRRATDAEALRRVYEEIDALEKTKVRTTEFTDYRERFAPLAAAAAAALLVEALLAGTVLRRVP
jgi:Ca-activated chloride channel family protein